jgi:hypothetical protein
MIGFLQTLNPLSMRQVLVLLCFLWYSFSFGQDKIPGDSLNSRVYDTLSITVGSNIYFPFCGAVYTLPRDCNGNQPPNCCIYETSVQKNQKQADWGYVSCYNGSSFHWYYTNSLVNAGNQLEEMTRQIKKQQKTYKEQKIKCQVFDTETEARVLELESLQGYKSYLLASYGTHNGYYFYIEYWSSAKIVSTADLQPVFRQILQLK